MSLYTSNEWLLYLAIKRGGTVGCWRQRDYRIIRILLGDSPAKAESSQKGDIEGFITNKASFVSGRRAKEIAIASGQFYARVKRTPFTLNKLNWDGLVKK